MENHAIVLMSTYNGQQYLQEQLQSIVEQTYSGPITILVRDDGSQDQTLHILENYPQRGNRFIKLIKGQNLGPQRSFLDLIQLADEADYYFFADQDDIWDHDKIEIAINAMAQTPNTPTTYCSNFRLSDMGLNVYATAAIKISPHFTPLRIIFYNQIPGCVMGLNRMLMNDLKQMHLENVMMHDSMALSYAALTGNVIFDSESRITHRIHKSNVVGDGHKKIVLHKWIPEKISLLMQKEPYDLSNMADQFIHIAGDRIHTQYLEDILLLRDFKKKWKKTFQLLRHQDSHGPIFDRTTMSIRCKILFHIF